MKCREGNEKEAAEQRHEPTPFSFLFQEEKKHPGQSRLRRDVPQTVSGCLSAWQAGAVGFSPC